MVQPRNAHNLALRILASSLALLALAIGAPRARAQEANEWVLLNGDRTMVVDGVLLFETRVRFGTPMSINPPVISLGTGGQVFGSAELLEIETDRNFAIIRPATPLVQGGLYSLVTFAPITTFNAGGMLEEDAPSFEVEAHLSTATHLLARSCCSGPNLFGAPSAPPSCVPLLTETRPSVRITLRAPDDDRSSRQYIYKGVLDYPLEPSANQHWVSAKEAEQGFDLDPASNDGRYCYRIEAHRLTDGRMFTVARDCFEEEPSPITRSTPSEELLRSALIADRCTVPPAGLEVAWCKLNLIMCGPAPDLAICQFANVQRACSGFDVPDETLMQLVESGAADAGLLDDVEEIAETQPRDYRARDAGESDAGDGEDGDGGCSVRGPRRGGSLPACSLAILLMGVRILRRKRGHRQ